MRPRSIRRPASPTRRAAALTLGILTLAAPHARAQQPPDAKPSQVTTDTGRPVSSDDHSATVGAEGPTLLQHYYLLEKIARFDRERIPERVVHARGVGARGVFVSAGDFSAMTKAAFLSAPGKETPVFARMSTVVLPKGSAETARDVRGFAVKFYTEQGNYDIVGNDIPVFFIRDAIKFPDLVHSLKPSPVTNVQELERFFDFAGALPETTHMITWLFSDMGTPASYRMMDGFGIHAFKWVNAAGEVHYIKYRWLSKLGVKNLTDAQAKILAGVEPASMTKDMHDNIAAGNFPSWEFQVQVLKPEDLRKFDFDPLDATKVWPDNVVGWTPIGTMTLNQFPDNFFEQTEQVAFNTGAYVPGIEPSEDKLLQGRNFSYSDTQRHRLGVNYQQLPVNRPVTAVSNDNQEGLDDHNLKKGDVNYSPSVRAPGRLVADPRYGDSGTAFSSAKVLGPEPRDPQDYKQAGEHYRSMSPTDRDHLVMNLVGELKKVKARPVAIKLVSNLYRADADFGQKVAAPLGIDLADVRAMAMQKDASRP